MTGGEVVVTSVKTSRQTTQLLHSWFRAVTAVLYHFSPKLYPPFWLYEGSADQQEAAQRKGLSFQDVGGWNHACVSNQATVGLTGNLWSQQCSQRLALTQCSATLAWRHLYLPSVAHWACKGNCLLRLFTQDTASIPEQICLRKVACMEISLGATQICVFICSFRVVTKPFLRYQCSQSWWEPRGGWKHMARIKSWQMFPQKFIKTTCQSTRHTPTVGGESFLEVTTCKGLALLLWKRIINRGHNGKNTAT